MTQTKLRAKIVDAAEYQFHLLKVVWERFVLVFLLCFNLLLSFFREKYVGCSSGASCQISVCAVKQVPAFRFCRNS